MTLSPLQYLNTIALKTFCIFILLWQFTDDGPVAVSALNLDAPDWVIQVSQPIKKLLFKL
jgi:hypothetical protein